MFNFSDPLFIRTLLNPLVLSVEVGWVCLFEGAWGLKTLTSKYVLSNVPPQKPFAATYVKPCSILKVGSCTHQDFVCHSLYCPHVRQLDSTYNYSAYSTRGGDLHIRPDKLDLLFLISHFLDLGAGGRLLFITSFI